MKKGELLGVDLPLSLIAFVLVSLVLIVPLVSAQAELSLPSDVVTIEVSDGSESYFDTVLSNVPLGYDVTNGVYHGWCVDVRAEMSRSPATHEVKLYSSLSPPGELAEVRWDMINYILNHKQGAPADIQQAIWYFAHADGAEYNPTRDVAWIIVNDTLANGDGFVPASGQTTAVICYPVILFPDQPDVQISIIETSLSTVPELPTVFLFLVLMPSAIILAVAYRRREKSLRVST